MHTWEGSNGKCPDVGPGSKREPESGQTWVPLLPSCGEKQGSKHLFLNALEQEGIERSAPLEHPGSGVLSHPGPMTIVEPAGLVLRPQQCAPMRKVHTCVPKRRVG